MKNFEERLEDKLNKLPYEKHVDDGQYNDGVLSGFELGARWAYKDFERIERELRYDLKECWDQIAEMAQMID